MGGSGGGDYFGPRISSSHTRAWLFIFCVVRSWVFFNQDHAHLSVYSDMEMDTRPINSLVL